MAITAMVLLAVPAAAQATQTPPTWQTPTVVSPTAQSATEPDVGIDAEGDVTAVWLYASDGTNNVVQTSRHSPGGAWSTPTDLSATGDDAQDPKIAVNASGSAAAVWLLTEGSDVLVQVATRPAGGSWSAPETVSQTGEENAYDPSIAMDPDGDVFVIWTRYDGTTYTAQAAVDTGGTWGKTHTLSANGLNANASDLKVNSSGTAVAVWQSYDAEQNFTVDVETYTQGSGWGSSVDLANGSGPWVALDAAGDITVDWSQRQPDYQFEVASSSMQVGGSWSAPTLLSNSYNSSAAFAVSDSLGNPVLTWDTITGDTDTSYRSVQASTGGSSPATVDSRNAEDDLAITSLQSDATGDVGALMFEDDYPPAGLEISYESGGTGTWSTPTQIASYLTDFSFSALALSADENGAVVWQAMNGDTDYIGAALSTSTSITTAPPAKTNQTSATIWFSSTAKDPSFECRLDGGAFESCAWPVTYSDLTNGEHTVTVKTTDADGDVEPGAVSTSWDVNTVPPSVSVTNPTPSEVLYTTAPTITGTAGSSADDASNVNVNIYTGSTTTGTPQTLPASVSGGKWSVAAPELANNSYTVQVSQTDAFGNTGLSAPVTFQITNAPQVDHITHLQVNPSTFVAAASGPSVNATRKGSTGTTVSYSGTSAATTTFTVEHVLAGRRDRGTCAAPSKDNKHGPPCTRIVTIGTFAHEDAEQSIHFEFTGRIRGHKLGVGKYLLTAVSNDDAGEGPAVSIGLNIKR